MTDILEEFRLVVPADRRTAGQWTNFCCPGCGDRRHRGGLIFTPSGGFRYYCFNGGCEFNIHPTGWEPGNGFGGRPRKLFELLGGDIKRIPIKQLMKWNSRKYRADGEVEEEGEELEVAHSFPEVELPAGSQRLLDVYEHKKTPNKVMRFAVERMGSFVKEAPLFWSEEHPYYLILPYYHYRDRIVGYLGRHIYLKSGSKRFIQRAPTDYTFNQHILTSYAARYLFVVESPMDAMLLGCLAVRNDRLTEKQVNLLKVSGKDVVLIPDHKRGEWEGFMRVAEENNWFVSIPDWGGRANPDPLKATDIGDSVKTNGRLFTIKRLMEATTRNYTRAKVELGQRSV